MTGGRPADLTVGLAPMDRRSRLERLRAALDVEGSLLVTNLTNVCYLTGFTGSAALLLVSREGLWLLTDGRYATQAAEQLAASRIDEAHLTVGGPQDQVDALKAAVAGLSPVGLEAESVSWARQRRLAEALAPVEVVATTGVVEALRRTKDEGEVARIEAAAAVADAALLHCAPMIAKGVSEAELALALDTDMRARGADGSAFETIVASGPNAAMPHARPTGRRIERGELVVIDFGAVVGGYRSDVSRTFSAGMPRSSLAERMLEVVAASQRSGLEAVRAGVRASEVDQACRDVIADAGWSELFVHGTGHGVGLDIHEAPSVGARSADTLEDRSIVTVEPGVYMQGVGGVRIEDTVVVTVAGCRPLTNFPKDPILT